MIIYDTGKSGRTVFSVYATEDEKTFLTKIRKAVVASATYFGVKGGVIGYEFFIHQNPKLVAKVKKWAKRLANRKEGK